MAELIAARDRNKKEFGRVQITSFADPSNEKYIKARSNLPIVFSARIVQQRRLMPPPSSSS